MRAVSEAGIQYDHGIRHNLAQFLHQLLQVLLVGLTLGMMRTVVPALAETEFNVPKGSFLLLVAFVVAFGFVKGVLNFVAGRLSERIGRQRVLLIGWLAALPIPFMIGYGPSWNWIVAATVLLGVNQGLTWSMTQTAKLDITRMDQRGLTIGLNEFSGYFGVAIAGVVTGYMATAFGARIGLLVFGLFVIVVATGLTLLWVKDTLPWAKAEGARHAAGQATGPQATLSAQHFRSSDDLGSVHAGVVARSAIGGHQPGRASGKIRRRADLGVLSRLSLSAWLDPCRHWLGGGRLWLRLGWVAAFHRPALGSRGKTKANRVGYVPVRRWCGVDAAG